MPGNCSPSWHETGPVMDIAAWLRGLSLERYAEAFRDNAIELEVLPELSEADLEKIGVLLGHRKIMLKAIAELRPPTPQPVQTAPVLPDAAERRQLTVMFCDLVGSTALSVRFDPEELREELRAYQNAVSGVVARYDGFVAKFMGDGVLVYFGYPRAHEDDAERAVRAELEIAAAVTRLETHGTERLAASASPPGLSSSAIWSATARRRSRRWSARPPT